MGDANTGWAAHEVKFYAECIPIKCRPSSYLDGRPVIHLQCISIIYAERRPSVGAYYSYGE